MSPAVFFISYLLSCLTMLGDALIMLLLISFLFGSEISRIRARVAECIGDRAVLFCLLVVVAAVSGSLFYSEIAGFEPCKLCWFQRIFMYPQVILLGMALWKKDRDFASYAIALSVPGAIIAGYHYLLQLGMAPGIPCSAVGYSVSCSQRFVLQFGYITMPMMALTAFALIILCACLQLSQKSEKNQRQGGVDNHA